MALFSAADQTPDTGDGSCSWNQSSRVDLMEAKGNFMPKSENGRTVETPTEARQAEPGPSVLMLLAISTILTVLILGGVWMVYFLMSLWLGSLIAGRQRGGRNSSACDMQPPAPGH
jgi:hypothetical protein